MSEKIVQLNEEVIKGKLKELVRGGVEETLNGLLEAEAEKLTQAGRYERSEQRQGYRSGHYNRNLMTTAGEVKLHVPRLKGVTFETAIIERYRRRESSVTCQGQAAASGGGCVGAEQYGSGGDGLRLRNLEISDFVTEVAFTEFFEQSL